MIIEMNLSSACCVVTNHFGGGGGINSCSSIKGRTCIAIRSSHDNYVYLSETNVKWDLCWKWAYILSCPTFLPTLIYDQCLRLEVTMIVTALTLLSTASSSLEWQLSFKEADPWITETYSEMLLILTGTMEELHSLDPRRQELLEARFMGGVSGSTGGSTGSASGGAKVS